MRRAPPRMAAGPASGVSRTSRSAAACASSWGRSVTRCEASGGARSGRYGQARMISVVIPVKDGGGDLVRCLDRLAAQQVDEDVEIVVVDSGSRDGSVAVARGRGARVHEIPPAEFNHGATRNLGARLAGGDVLVFTSQDAYAADEHWLARLVAPLADERVGGAYGR